MWFLRISFLLWQKQILIWFRQESIILGQTLRVITLAYWYICTTVSCVRSAHPLGSGSGWKPAIDSTYTLREWAEVRHAEHASKHAVPVPKGEKKRSSSRWVLWSRTHSTYSMTREEKLLNTTSNNWESLAYRILENTYSVRLSFKWRLKLLYLILRSRSSTPKSAVLLFHEQRTKLIWFNHYKCILFYWLIIQFVSSSSK